MPMRSLVFAFTLVLHSSVSLQAQQAPAAQTPILPTAPIVAPEQQNTPLRILVIGDGLAGGLGAGLTRLAEEGEPIYVDNRFDETSGFSRPESFNWIGEFAKIPADAVFTSAVILSGINDKREYRKANDRFVFGTPEWKTVFTAEIDLFLDALKAKNIKPIWVSLPPMQNLTFDTEMQLLNSIYKSRVEAKGGMYIDIRKSFLDQSGQYADRGPDVTGAIRKLRSRDGVTFFKNGNNLLAALVLDGIRNGAAAPVVTPSTTPTPSPAITTAPLPTAPIFAQEGVGGTNVILSASDIKIVIKPPTIAVEKIGLAAGELGVFTPLKGTSAEKLLSTGEAGSAPAGRFDDFTLAP